MPVPHEASPEELGSILGLTSRALGKLVERGVLERTSRGRYPLAASVQKYLRYRESLIEDRVHGGEESFAAGRARKVWEEVRALEDARRLREGTLLSADGLAKSLDVVGQAMRTRLLAIPTRLSAQLAPIREPAKIFKLLSDAIHEALTEISNFNLVAAEEAPPARPEAAE
jgi:hypothetical protein